MMPARAVLALSILAAIPAAQDKSTGIDDIIKSYEKFLKTIEGFKEIQVDRSQIAPSIIIRVESQEAKDTVGLVLKDNIGEFPLRIVISLIPLSDSIPKSSEKPSPSGELTCTHCPIHCASSSHLTVVDPSPSPDPSLTKGEVPASETTSWDRCDVARKWLGLPRRAAPPGGACEVMVSWSDDPTKVKWALAQRLPHWRSKDMTSIRGSDKTGIPCPEHGSHNQGEIVCYTWIKHNLQCPLAKIVAPKDLLSPGNMHLDDTRTER